MMGFSVLLMVLFFGALVWFTRKSLFILAALFLALPLAAQDCDTVATDSANVFNGRLGAVAEAARPLLGQGADVRVRTLVSSGGNLDLAEQALVRACPSWQGANGSTKSTLLVLMMSKDRKLGIYYGSAWHNALDNHWNRIKQDYMVPRFRDGNFAGGFIAAEEQLTKRLVAAKDESLKPAISQTVNQASDLSWMKGILGWLVVLGFLGLIAYWALRAYRKHREDQEDLRDAQADAVAERNAASSALNSFADKLATKEAAGETVPDSAKYYFSSASEDYGRLAGSANSDPSSDGLTKSEYLSLRNQYSLIRRKVGEAAQRLTPSLGGTPPVDPPPVEEPAPAPVVPNKKEESSKVVVINNSDAGTQYIPTPIFTPPVVVVENEPIVHHHHHEDDDSSSSFGSSSFGSSSSSGESGGGGSSSWSSSDSSSSFDSGGSSSFDSGGSFGSDSGGGSGSW